MSTPIIKQIYEARIAALAKTLGRRVAFEDDGFEPAVDEIYWQVFILPGTTGSQDLAGAHRNYGGVVQINVVTPKGGGAKKGLDDAARIVAHFPLYQDLTKGAVTVKQVSPADNGPGIPNATTYSVPVSFRYRADTI